MNAAFVASASAVDKWYNSCKDVWGDAKDLRATLRGRADLLLAVNSINHDLSNRPDLKFTSLDVARLDLAPEQSRISKYLHRVEADRIEAKLKVTRGAEAELSWFMSCRRFGSGSWLHTCLLYTSPSPRDKRQSRMPSSA